MISRSNYSTEKDYLRALDHQEKEKNSVIYSIRSHKTEKYYVGSTYQTLAKRFSDHKRNFKRYLKSSGKYCASFEILKYDDAYIEIIESYSGLDRHYLFKKEGEYIRENRDKLVNVK
jgi:hypothetical protein